jgi:hypothetical protein
MISFLLLLLRLSWPCVWPIWAIKRKHTHTQQTKWKDDCVERIGHKWTNYSNGLLIILTKFTKRYIILKLRAHRASPSARRVFYFRATKLPTSHQECRSCQFDYYCYFYYYFFIITLKIGLPSKHA